MMPPPHAAANYHPLDSNFFAQSLGESFLELLPSHSATVSATALQPSYGAIEMLQNFLFRYCNNRLIGITRIFAASLLFLMLPANVKAVDLAGPYARQVQQMYVAYYGRPGDVAGIQYWGDRLEAAGGNWIPEMVNAFGNTPEYVNSFGYLTSDQLIDNLFSQLFNRVSDGAGQAYYLDLLSGTNATGYNPELRQSSLAMIALDIANGAAGEDYTTLQNKLHVADYFTQGLQTHGIPYTGSDIPTASQVVAAVGTSDTSVANGYAQADAFFNATGSGHLSGSWRLAAYSDVYPGCGSTGDLVLQHNEIFLSGTASVSGNCMGGPYSGTVTGTADGNRIEMRVDFVVPGEPIQYLGFEGYYQSSEALSEINGRWYDWSYQDYGSARLSR